MRVDGSPQARGNEQIACQGDMRETCVLLFSLRNSRNVRETSRETRETSRRKRCVPHVTYRPSIGMSFPLMRLRSLCTSCLHSAGGRAGGQQRPLKSEHVLKEMMHTNIPICKLDNTRKMSPRPVTVCHLGHMFGDLLFF